MTKSYATRESGELVSASHLREPISAILTARPDGVGEAMLMHMVRVTDDQPVAACAPAYVVTKDDPWLAKVRQTCRALGASRSAEGVWRLAA